VSFQQHFDELTAGIEKYIRAIVEHGPKPVSPVIRQALSIMERDYHRSDLGIDYMARTLNLNGVYFSQLFKKEQGLSFTEALNQIRLGHAQRLLKQSQLKIKEIAGEVGYADPHYFGIWFKDKTGLTPLQFRKQNQ
jgi:two-component system response regulator YesN